MKKDSNEKIGYSEEAIVTEREAEDILKKYSKEDNVRSLNKSLDKYVNILSFILSIFLIYTGAFGSFPALRQRSIFLGFVMTMLFLIYPAYSRKSRKGIAWHDYIFALLSAICCIYVIVQYEPILLRMGISNTIDQVIGSILIILILEGTRRVSGSSLVVVTLIFVLYGFFGNHLPGIFRVRVGGLSRLIDYLFMIPEGIFGTPLGTAATYVSLFVIFSELLQASGMGEFIQDIALAIAGKSSGGPAKVAVFASAIFGTISGSAAANVVGTGTFTIPLMKKIGYEPEFAGAVEACASTGGQLIPPVMGAACFIMAEYIGVPYSKIMLGALIPGALYYFSIFVTVHLRAKRKGMNGLDDDQLPDGKKALRERGHLIIPFIAVIILIIRQYTISFAAIIGIVLVLLVSNLRKTTRMTPKVILASLVNGGKKCISFGASCACIGIIIGIVTLTGVGNLLGDYILTLSQGNLLLTLFLISIISIILGMGMPTVAVYIVLATVAAPALVKLGIPILAAHMFCFYFGILACVTPPVAIPSYAAAALAGGNPSKTGWLAFRMAIPSFLIPYVFVYNTSLLFINTNVFSLLTSTITAIIGVYMLAAGFERYIFRELSKLKSTIVLVGGVLFIMPDHITDVIAIGILVMVLLTERKYKINKEAKLI